MINVEAKIGSKALSQRLEKILLQLIEHNQNAFSQGRSIFDSVRTFDDIIELYLNNDTAWFSHDYRFRIRIKKKTAGRSCRGTHGILVRCIKLSF